jgi:hypothetical protein
MKEYQIILSKKQKKSSNQVGMYFIDKFVTKFDQGQINYKKYSIIDAKASKLCQFQHYLVVFGINIISGIGQQKKKEEEKTAWPNEFHWITFFYPFVP